MLKFQIRLRIRKSLSQGDRFEFFRGLSRLVLILATSFEFIQTYYIFSECLSPWLQNVYPRGFNTKLQYEMVKLKPKSGHSISRFLAFLSHLYRNLHP